MESVGDVLKDHPSRFQYQDLVQQIVKDPDVVAFIQKESLSQEELNRSISKFNQYITERDKFLRWFHFYILDYSILGHWFWLGLFSLIFVLAPFDSSL